MQDIIHCPDSRKGAANAAPQLVKKIAFRNMHHIVILRSGRKPGVEGSTLNQGAYRFARAQIPPRASLGRDDRIDYCKRYNLLGFCRFLPR